jgi:hypothetical protein
MLQNPLKVGRLNIVSLTDGIRVGRLDEPILCSETGKG